MKQAGKLPFLRKAIGAGANKSTSAAGRLGQKAVRAAPGVATLGALTSMVDEGPNEGDTIQRAMNQLKYGADMTDDELQDAIAGGQTFTDSGVIGENGLNEDEVRAYITQNADQRGGAEKWGGRVIDALSFINPVATIGGAIYDNQLGKARNQNLQNIVGKLKADANEGTIRKNMEGSLGKFMAEGLLNKDFGRGKVRSEGGIKGPVDKKAQEEEAAALKEYESIKARDGVHAAIAHPSALKAGRQVYIDVQEASGGDKNTAEALLSGAGGQEGVGLTDQPTMEKYYGNREKNALANKATSAEAALASQKSNAAMAQAAAAEQTRIENTSGPIQVNPATTADGVRENQALINAQKGFHGESPVAAEQRAYLDENGIQSARSASRHMTAVGNAMYQKAYGYAPGSPEATADAWNRLYKNIDAGRKQYQANRAAAADREYADKIVKPGDPDYKLGPQASKGPTDAAMAEYMGQTAQGGGAPAPAPTVPAQVNASAAAPQPSVSAPSRAAILTQGRPGPAMAPEQSPNPNVMKPTPNGLGGPTPGMPQLPDIGGPARRAGEAVGNAIFSQDGTGIPLPGGANLKPPLAPPAPRFNASPYGIGRSSSDMQNMPYFPRPNTTGLPEMQNMPAPPPSGLPTPRPTPYGLGTATPGMPQVPDIAAPGKAMGSAIGNLLFNQNQPGNPPLATNNTPAYDAKGNLTDPKIAEMLAEQKRREVGARNAANKPKSNATRPDPMGRFIR